MALKEDGAHFVLCPKQGNKIESVVLGRVCILKFFLLNRVRVSNLQRLIYTHREKGMGGGGKYRAQLFERRLALTQGLILFRVSFSFY